MARETAEERVIQMRDDFLLLVAAYNSIGEYADALDAQTIAMALNKFEDDHNITEIAWPPERAGEEHDYWLKRPEDFGDEMDEPYTLDEAMRYAKLWRAGKLLGGDSNAVIFALLGEIERLRGDGGVK